MSISVTISAGGFGRARGTRRGRVGCLVVWGWVVWGWVVWG
jgi:hypothetical protein